MIVQYTTYRAESAGKVVLSVDPNIHHGYAQDVET